MNDGVYTVISTMKNEGAFLLEWVAHHKVLGFDHLVVCTNDSEDATVPMLLRLQEIGLARHHATRIWQAAGIQRSALKQVKWYAEVTKADWLYVCEADEFLTIRSGDGTVRHLVSRASPTVDVISVPWRIFGSNGLVAYHDQPVTVQFTHAEPLPVGPVVQAVYPKSLFTGLANFHRIGIHGPVPREDLGRDIRRELPGGIPTVPLNHKQQVPPIFDVAQVNHYPLRSRHSFLVKRDRGRVNHARQTMSTDYWRRFDLNATRDAGIRRYDAATADWVARLKSDPVLGPLHREAVDWHQQRIRTLSALPEYAAMLDEIAALDRTDQARA